MSETEKQAIVKCQPTVNGSSPNTDLPPNGKALSKRPQDILLEKASVLNLSIHCESFAKILDEEDPLKTLRDDFWYPKNKDLPEDEVDLTLVDGERDCIYFCGNSLGLQPKGVKDNVNRELDKWAKTGVYGHFKGEMPWALCDECIQEKMASIVGAEKEEVALMNGLTVNLHFLLISFYRPTPDRHKILLEDHSFPSDHYTVESQIRLHGYDPKSSMILMKPREGEETLRPEDIARVIEEEGDSIAVVMFPGVQYYTGQLFDMATITKQAKAKGCHVGFDLAHAVGNVEINLHDWGTDFACWCSYKYLNSGAGGIGGIFVHENYADNSFPRLHGWWSHKMSSRFNMNNVMDASEGAAGYRVSNPPLLLMLPLEASLSVFHKTTMTDLRNKSKLLTGYLELLLMHYFPEPAAGEGSDETYVRIVTPRDPDERGAQLSVMFSVPITKLYKELKKRGVVLDKREPNVLRLAPAPLYNRFHDVWRFLSTLQEALRSSY